MCVCVIYVTTGVTKAMLCVILSILVHIKDLLLLIETFSPCCGYGGISFSRSGT